LKHLRPCKIFSLEHDEGPSAGIETCRGFFVWGGGNLRNGYSTEIAPQKTNCDENKIGERRREISLFSCIIPRFYLLLQTINKYEVNDDAVILYQGNERQSTFASLQCSTKSTFKGVSLSGSQLKPDNNNVKKNEKGKRKNGNLLFHER